MCLIHVHLRLSVTGHSRYHVLRLFGKRALIDLCSCSYYMNVCVSIYTYVSCISVNKRDDRGLMLLIIWRYSEDLQSKRWEWTTCTWQFRHWFKFFHAFFFFSFSSSSSSFFASSSDCLMQVSWVGHCQSAAAGSGGWGCGQVGVRWTAGGVWVWLWWQRQ